MHRIIYNEVVTDVFSSLGRKNHEDVTPIYTTVSCDINIQNLLLSLPLRQFNLREQRDNSIAAQVGSCSLRSGEFVRENRVLKELHAIIADIPDAHAYAIGVQNVELFMETPSGRFSLLEPWTSTGIFSIDSFSLKSRMKLSMDLEPIMLSMTETTLFNLLEVIEYLSRRWVRVAQSKVRVPSSKLGLALELDLRFKCIIIRLLPYSQRPLSVTVESLIESFDRLISVRGIEARVSRCYLGMLEWRLEALGLSSKQREELLAEFLYQKDQQLATGGQSTFSCDKSWNSNLCGDRLRKVQHILCIDCRGLNMQASITSLVNSISLKSSRLVVTDSDLTPLFVIRGDKDNEHDQFTFSWNSYQKPNEIAKHLELIAAHVELRLSSELQRTIDALHRALLPVQLKLEFLVTLFSGCYSRTAFDNSKPTTLNSTINIDEANILLIHKEQLLAELRLSPLKIAALGWNYELTSTGLEVVDLSEMGALHPVVVWGREQGCSLTLRAGDGEDPSLELKGLRFCYLSRFVQELFIFYDFAVLRSVHAFESYWQEAAIAREVPMVNAEYSSFDQDSDNDSYDSDEADLLMSCSHVTYTPMAEMAQVSEEQNPQPSKQFPCEMHFDDATFYFPRNSSSRDTLGVTVESAYYKGFEVFHSWPVPDSFEERREGAHRTFDTAANHWCFDAEPSACSDSQPPSGQFVRNEYGVRGCQLFTSVSGPLHNRPVVEVRSDELKLFMEVSEDAPVFCVFSRFGGETSRERWRTVSGMFHFLLVWDSSEAVSRILFADTIVLSHLGLSLSLAEYCLLLSIYYGMLFVYNPFGLLT